MGYVTNMDKKEGILPYLGLRDVSESKKIFGNDLKNASRSEAVLEYFLIIAHIKWKKTKKNKNEYYRLC